MEATAYFHIRNDVQLGFFIPDYYRQYSTIRKDHVYEIELAGFAYHLNKFKPQTFDIDRGPMLEEKKLELRKEGKEDNIASVQVSMNEDMCNISNGFFCDDADDISVIAKIDNIREFKFMDEDCYEIILKFDERGGNMALPIFVGKYKFEEDYIPQVGDTVEGVIWLQGFIRNDEGLNTVNVISTDNSDDDIDIGLLSAVREKEHNLDDLIVNALKEKSHAEDIMMFKAGLNCDPDFICNINGQRKYIKVMTGYFDTEQEYDIAYAEFKKNIIENSVFVQIIPLALVGIKMEEYYKIYYNGFAEINPEPI